MIQLQNKLRPVKDGMFEVLVERDGIMRTSVDTQLAEHTSSEVIFIFCQDFLLLAVFSLDRFAGYGDCIVRTSYLTQSAGYTAVFVILIVGCLLYTSCNGFPSI